MLTAAVSELDAAAFEEDWEYRRQEERAEERARYESSFSARSARL